MRKRAIPCAVVLAIVALVPASATAQSAAHATADPVANALSAAPAAVAAHATVMDASGKVLRKGTNGWTCLPDNPDTAGNSPMCLDAAWLAWAQAWMSHETPPKTKAVSFAYMLQGDAPTSNTDPFATGPTADNQWIEDSGPHLMILVPDAASLNGISTDPHQGGPFVMWKGTPYVHLMVPVGATD